MSKTDFQNGLIIGLAAKGTGTFKGDMDFSRPLTAQDLIYLDENQDILIPSSKEILLNCEDENNKVNSLDEVTNSAINYPTVAMVQSMIDYWNEYHERELEELSQWIGGIVDEDS